MNELFLDCGVVALIAGTVTFVLGGGLVATTVYGVVHRRVASRRRLNGKPLPLLPFPWLFAPRWRVWALVRTVEDQGKIIQRMDRATATLTELRRLIKEGMDQAEARRGCDENEPDAAMAFERVLHVMDAIERPETWHNPAAVTCRLWDDEPWASGRA
jgi:hypothetical protein